MAQRNLMVGSPDLMLAGSIISAINTATAVDPRAYEIRVLQSVNTMQRDERGKMSKAR